MFVNFACDNRKVASPTRVGKHIKLAKSAVSLQIDLCKYGGLKLLKSKHFMIKIIYCCNENVCTW